MQCRWAKSLGELEGTHYEAWGTTEYMSRKKAAVFFGLYDMRDYLALLRHKGLKYILWAGSDIKNLANNFCFNDGKLKWVNNLFPLGTKWLKEYINQECISYVETQAEAQVLSILGIQAKEIIPSFLGRKENYKVSFKPSKTPHVYTSCSGNRQEEYGFSLIEAMAPRFPSTTFHLYGAKWITRQPNIIVHGRVSKEVMNEETKEMQGSLRLNSFDGFSEITAKSILWGQYPATVVKQRKITHILHIDDLGEWLYDLSKKRKPNIEARNYYLKTLNNYPWAQ